MGSGSCCDRWKKNGVPAQCTAHGNPVCQDHVEQKRNHVLQDHAAKSRQLEYVHRTSPLCQTSHLGHNKWKPQRKNTDFSSVGKDRTI